MRLGWLFFSLALGAAGPLALSDSQTPKGRPSAQCSQLVSSSPGVHRTDHDPVPLPALIEGKPAVVLVDSYSSGIFLPAYLKSLGFAVVHVQTTPDMPERYGMGSHNPSWTGNIDQQLLWQGEATLRILRQYNIKASMGPTDAGHAVSDTIALALKLPMNDPKLTVARGQKDLANDILSAHGIAVAKQHYGDLTQILSWAERLGKWPIWVKPRQGTGNDGVSECYNAEQVKAAYQSILSRPTQLGLINEGILAQEDIPGPEFITDFVYLDGEPVLANIAEYQKIPRLRADGSTTHIYKATNLLDGDGPRQRLLVAYGASLLKPLGAITGTSHIELKLTPDGPRIVEHNPRFVGGKLTKLISIAVGIGPMELWTEALLFPDRFRERIGKAPYQLKKHARIIHMISDHSGIITGTPYLDQIRKHPAYQYDYVSGVGSALAYTVDLDTGPGLIYAAHENLAVLDELEAWIRSLEARDAFFTYQPL